MKENVVIIGGGVAGLAASQQLKKLGYQPIIVEQKAVLGGHVNQWYKLFPDMSPAADVIKELTNDLSGINIFLETKVINWEKNIRNEYDVSLSNGVQIHCKAVLVASGFKLFPAEKKEEYGYGVYDHVISNADLEKWFAGKKDDRIPKDPQAIGFVHCVGSRDLKAGNSQCSKVCCTTAIKQAIEMKERYPNAEIYCFYMDLRLFGKKYEDFYINAQQEFGVHFVRGRISEVGEDINGRVQIKCEDTLMGKPLKVKLDLLVLMSGMVCNVENQVWAKQLHLDIDNDGFLKSENNVSHIVQSNRPGIFYAGACTGTKTVPETLAEASAAALAINDYLRS